MIYRYLLFSLILLAGVIFPVLNSTSVVTAHPPSPEAADPRPGVKFSHQLHSDLGILCADCHTKATTSTMSSDMLWTDHDACMSCHEDQLGNDCAYCHADPENIQEVTPIERTIIFPHATHSTTDCQTCHAEMSTKTDFSTNSLPSMETCYTCHNNQTVSNTCESCHRDFVTLFPSNHQRSDFIRNHRETIRLGGVEQSCQTCHTETFCQECHQSVGLKAFGSDGLMTDPRPKISVRDNADQMTLQFAHELNYRFFHGIDAKDKQAECASCHEPQTFCAECHAAGGDVNQFRFKPASHLVPGFTTIGRGTGGGLHAEEARRDIESCVSCHDVEGQDPTCLICHTEGGMVR